MVAPKRMAEETAEYVDLGTVAPRRGVPAAPAGPFRGRRLLRVALAPVAALSVAGLATGLLVVNPQSTATDATSPEAAASALGVSRNEARPALSVSPSPSPSPEPSASPSPSVEEIPSVEATPVVDYTTVGAEAGTMYASAGVNVRAGGSAEHEILQTLAAGDEVTITDRVIDGWQQVLLSDGVAGWMSSEYLVAEKPTPTYSTEPCPYSSSIEASITPTTVAAFRAICAQFPNVTSVGGYRPGAWGYHGTGQALDFMISGDAGWELAYWAQANAAALGINEIIYSQRIWTTSRSGEGWRWMADRGSVTENHYDHVHISVGGTPVS